MEDEYIEYLSNLIGAHKKGRAISGGDDSCAGTDEMVYAIIIALDKKVKRLERKLEALED